MTVESALNFAQLNPSLPAATDPLAEGANHIRLLKTLLQTTFPAIAAPVACTDADLNALHAALGSLTALATGVIKTTGANTLKGSLSLNQVTPGTGDGSGVLNAWSVQQGGVPLVPAGVVVMWSGTFATIPAGWTLCNGTNGTPDLRSQFIMGAGTPTDIFQPGTTGGAPTIAVPTSTAGVHTHTGSAGYGGGFSLTASMDQQGAHSHGGSSQGHTLTTAEMPAHTHNAQRVPTTASTGGAAFAGSNNGYASGPSQTDSTGGGGAHSHGIATDGTHAHNITVPPVAGHTHSIPSDGSHSHIAIVPLVPPFFALCFIMKT